MGVIELKTKFKVVKTNCLRALCQAAGPDFDPHPGWADQSKVVPVLLETVQ